MGKMRLSAVIVLRKLKAIVVKGSKVLHFYDEKNLKHAVFIQLIKQITLTKIMYFMRAQDQCGL